MTTLRHTTTPQHASDEDGVALFYALLVAVVVAGVVAVTFAAALTEQRQSALELDFEDTLHVAEAGAEVGLQEVLGDGTITNASDPATFAGTETEWAVAQASDATRTPVRIGEGEAVWLRPSTGSTEFVYGVGFSPSRDAFLTDTGEAFARVVRMEVGFTDAFAPGLYAFLSDRVLSFNGGGSSSVNGNNGSVHTNGSFDPPSSSNFSFSGTVSYHECSTTNCAGAGYTETDVVVPINAGTLDEIYNTETARDYLSDGGDWYDYCGGVWFKRLTDGNDNGIPCDGEEVAQTGGVPGFSGTTQQSNGADGVYFFNGDLDVQLSSDDVTMTIITGGDINLPSGNVSFNWFTALDGVYGYAGNDVDWGNVDVNAGSISCTGGLSAAERAAAEAIDAGILYAGNDILMGGNPSAVQIAFIAENDVVFNGGGNRCVVLETDASGDLGGRGLPVVVQWDELN